MPPALKSIDHVHVFVTNRSAATAWYEDVMGMSPVPELAFWSVDGGPLTIADPGGNVHIALFEAAASTRRSTVALGVSADAFIAWREHLGDKLGRPVRAEDHQVSWSLYFSDPDGNPYEITTYEYEAVSRLLKADV
jgi:catechol 2,3-dioxygenase-like lactoylglutathione lyase family enzyme